MHLHAWLLAFSLLLVACGGGGGGSGSSTNTTTQTPPTASAAVIPYPLTTCLISNEPLGSMGPAVVLIHEGQELKFCCKSCIKDFHADPVKVMAKLAMPPLPTAGTGTTTTPATAPHCAGCNHGQGGAHQH